VASHDTLLINQLNVARANNILLTNRMMLPPIDSVCTTEVVTEVFSLSNN